MTFHDHVMTFVMTDEDPWMTLATLGDSLLKILTTIVKTHWQPWRQLWLPIDDPDNNCWLPLMTQNDNTDDCCRCDKLATYNDD